MTTAAAVASWHAGAALPTTKRIGNVRSSSRSVGGSVVAGVRVSALLTAAHAAAQKRYAADPNARAIVETCNSGGGAGGSECGGWWWRRSREFF